MKWENVDKIIFVAEHIREFVVNVFQIDREKTVVIPNGVKLDKWTFKNRVPGYNIAYVGYINYKKGPMLLLHTFKSIYDRDRRYKLFLAGQFQDMRDKLYFEQMVREFGLEKNFFFDGWQNDLDKWLENKSYILCTSILESQNMSVMQAMAKGIKPIIHNFVGAKQIYDEKYLWNTIDEALEMITGKDYNSQEYRNFIEKNYSFSKQIDSIKKIINSLEQENVEIKQKEDDDITSFLYNGKSVSFYLPFKYDYIQNVIRNTKNFYELSMLEDIKKRMGKYKVIVDVGANIGNHTVFFAKICKAKKVYSFEPQKNIFEILKTNVKINGLDSIVELFNMGLGDQHTFAKLEITDQNKYGMTKINKNTPGDIEVAVLDDILFGKTDRIDMLKIDVEGMEIDVLKGAKKILNHFKPKIYIEAGTEEEFESVYTFLKGFGYIPKHRFNATPTYLFEHSFSVPYNSPSTQHR